MTKILMVCLGNICRSPVAEGVMRAVAKENKLNITVDSAGTSNYHIGEQPDRRSMANAKKNGIDISELRGRQFTTSDFDIFDKIYVMDESNLKNVVALAKNEEQRQKVDLLLNELHPGKNMPVPDPYYGTEKDFEQVFQLTYSACKLIAEKLKQECNK